MARFIYTALFYLLLPFILLRMLWRSRKAPEYAKRWSERFGFFAKPNLKEKVIWVHAVSVGESLAAAPLIENLFQRYADVSIVVTTTTPTGSDRIKHLFRKQLGRQLFHVYCPYDLPTCVYRFLNRIQPSLLIIMETELWPNTIAACEKRQVPVLLANGRLSEKSAKGYAKIKGLIQPSFRYIVAAVQSNDDGQRMQALGLAPENCHVTGSIKFDLTIDEHLRKKASELKQHLNSPEKCKVLIAASTHDGEEKIVLEAFKEIKQNYKNTFLILVPRHPERFDSVATLIKQEGFHFNRRSENRIEVEAEVLLGDTMGELLLLLGAADAAFIGGSLVHIGGHNLMEPAAWGLPILTGPHLFNFSEVSDMLINANALSVVQSTDQLATTVMELWQHEEQRALKGEKALAIANDNRGALLRLIQLVEIIY